jgi:acetyltransferase-like isoleucine patch superfamily enzyme
MLMNKYGDYVSLADVIRVTGSTDFDLHHHDMQEEISARDIAYNDVGLTVCGVVTIFCDSPRFWFAKVLGLWEEPDMMRGSDFAFATGTMFYRMPPPMGFNNVIGGSGFGYERGPDRVPLRIPHLGRVVFGDGVELGSCVCIDRGVIGDTVIGDNVKIDNLVHVAHNAQIGKNTLIVAGAVIGGSVVIGEKCFIGMNASIKQKVKIGNNVTVGAGAVVLKDIPDGETWVGNPARKLEKQSNN